MNLKLLLLAIHIFCAACWFGCVLVEAVYEHTAEPTDTMRRFIARLHRRTDVWVEIPAFCGVLLTGTILFMMSTLTSLLMIKILAGTMAVAANAVCVVLVKKRLTTAMQGDFAHYERLDKLQHRLGAVVLLGMVAAFAVGIYLFAHGVM